VRSLLFIGVLVGVLATPPLWAYEVIRVADGGVLAGKVLFTGTPPAPKQILINSDVVAFYNAGGGQAPSRDARLKPLGLTDMEQQALVKFLESLSGDPVTIEPPTLPEYQVWKIGK